MQQAKTDNQSNPVKRASFTVTQIHNMLSFLRNLVLCGSMDRSAFILDLSLTEGMLLQKFENHSKYMFFLLNVYTFIPDCAMILGM